MKLRKTALKYFLGSVFFAIVLLTLHLGYGEYLSTQFIFFALLLGYSITSFGIQKPSLVIALCLFFLGALSCFLSSQDMHQYFVIARFSLVVYLLHSFTRVRRVNPDLIAMLVGGFSIALIANAIAALGQTLDSIYYNTGYFDIPKELFALNYGTLLTDLRATSSGLSGGLRASGFYSEPSALAAFGIVCLYIYATRQNMAPLYIISFIPIIISKSISGYAAAAFLMFYVKYLAKGQRNSMLVSARQLAAVISFVAIFYVFLHERLHAVFAGLDQSFAIRISTPLEIVSQQFRSGYFFGWPVDVIKGAMPYDMNTVFDNWIFNNLMLFGLLGLLFYLIVVFSLGRHLGVMVFLFSFFNGDPLYYDRVILLSLLILILNGATRSREVDYVTAKRHHDFFQ